MFGLQELLNRWTGGNGQRYRLVPLDWWMDELEPLTIQVPATVGRSADAQVRLTDPWVSRIHCELSQRDGKLIIRDLESRHGVYVNEQRVSQAVLHPGDVLLLGVSRYRIEFDEPVPDPAPPHAKERS